MLTEYLIFEEALIERGLHAENLFLTYSIVLITSAANSRILSSHWRKQLVILFSFL